MVLRIFYNMIVFGFILILCNSVDIVFTKSVNKCVDDPIEAQRDKADVIVTATVLKLNKGVQIDGTYSTNVQVKRVYKGNAIVSKIKSRIRGIRRYRNYNKVIQISGFGADDICESDVKEGDTKLFLVIQDSYKDLKLSSSVQKISVYNLNRINAIAKGLPFNLPPPTQSPCLGHFCAFHATCQVNASSKSPYCVCVNNCKQNWKSEVCGTDGQTYNNLCELQQSSCRQQKRLKADYDGKCNDPCDGKQCQDQQVCQLNEERKPVCKCEETCDPIVSHVCGSDGRTYSNECMLRQQACQTQRDIVVTHPGACKEPLGPCRDFHCTYDAVCQVENGFPKCRCPVCSEQLYDPVCGTNGISHKSECELKKENCEQRKSVEVEHRGLCTSNGCERNSEVCKYHSSCQREDNGIWRCVCPSNCPRTGAKVCGTDGVTYDNECELRKQGCKKQREIAVVALGDCVECNGRYCKNGAKCQRGQCVCPQECPLERNPICANDGESYRNQCEMERVSCRLGEDLRIVKSGYCDIIEGSAEGSGDLECDETTCQYGGTCQLEDDGSYRCACPFSCDAIRSPVCGSDGNSYGNKCEMHAASCQQQKLIMVQAWENCDFVEELCDGARPVYDMHTGVEFTCTGAEGCPAGSYCHLQFRRCCSEERLSDTFIRGCSESEFGCCDDHVTFASGPRKKGCPDMCQCEPLGSLSAICDPDNKQCKCKPGVGGLKCDSCMPGFWGLREIEIKNLPGCLACNCHKVGATRLDCDQNTGRCVCKPGYGGNKCDICVETNKKAGRYGCYVDPHSPTSFPMTIRSRKTTRDVSSHTPTKTKYTPKPPIIKDKYGRIDDLCLENSYCDIPNSHCHMLLCKCDEGYIPTMENTMCSPVKSTMNHTKVLPDKDPDPCELNNCLYGGICKPDDDLGYRCLCSIGRTGIYCKQKISFTSPSFSGSSYLVVEPLGKISGDFYLDIIFHSMNRDGILLFSSQFNDGTGQFVSIALNNGHVEFRYDMGGGPKQILHPHPISQDMYHQVVVKKIGQNAMLIVDESEPMAIISLDEQKYFDLSGKLYLGYLPQNLSFIQEKIGMNLGFVGCVRGLTAGHMNNATMFSLEYPSSSTHILDGIDIASCEMNPCQSLPCQNGGTCNMINTDYYQCWCTKGYTGENCESPVDPCTNSPCHSSATCTINISGDIICKCPKEREGRYCEYEKLSEVRVPEFFGDSYLVLQVPDNLARQMSIEIWFLTRERNGVLLFTTQYIGGGGDFVSLNIVDSFLEFRFDLGDGHVDIRSADRLKLNTWHKVVVQRVDREADLIVDDGEPSRGMSQGSLSELQFSGSIYMGGFDNERDLPLNANIRSNFTGVIQRLYINGKMVENMIDSALEKFHVARYKGTPCNINPCMNGGVCLPKLELAECKCPKKYIGQHCEKVAKITDTSDPVRFSGQTFLQYFNEIVMGQRAQKSNKFQFRFKTHQTAGMLIFQNQGQSIRGDYFVVAISGGHVELSFNLGKQLKDNLLRIKSNVYVSDGEWHTVSAERTRREGRLQVDKEVMVTGRSEPDATQLDTDSYLWIGGKPDIPRGLPKDYYAGFRGCLGDVFIKDKELHLFEHRNGATSTVIDFCH